MSFWLSIQLRGKNIQLEKYAFLSTSKPRIVGRGMADDSSQSHTPAIPPPALSPTRIRALVADDSRGFRTVIGELLKIEDWIEVVARLSDGQEAIEAVTVLLA